MQPGIYQFAGKSVELTAERCVRLVGTEYLAGSAIELARGIENSVRFAGISLKEAVSLATLQPMRLLDAKKRVAAHTNLILFEWDTAAMRTQSAGDNYWRTNWYIIRRRSNESDVELLQKGSREKRLVCRKSLRFLLRRITGFRAANRSRG